MDEFNIQNTNTFYARANSLMHTQTHTHTHADIHAKFGKVFTRRGWEQLTSIHMHILNIAYSVNALNLESVLKLHSIKHTLEWILKAQTTVGDGEVARTSEASVIGTIPLMSYRTGLPNINSSSQMMLKTDTRMFKCSRTRATVSHCANRLQKFWEIHLTLWLFFVPFFYRPHTSLAVCLNRVSWMSK